MPTMAQRRDTLQFFLNTLYYCDSCINRIRPMAAPQRPDLSSRQLHCVVALARYGSFVAAAADLGLSQPALTRAIMRIEQTLGVRLFTRSTRRVALTAGREFVPVAERLIADLDIGIQNMRTLGTRQRGRLVIASLMSVAYGLLPGIIAAYRTRHTGVDLELREGVLSAVTEDVRSGLADFGIGDLFALDRLAVGFGEIGGEVFRRIEVREGFAERTGSERGKRSGIGGNRISPTKAIERGS